MVDTTNSREMDVTPFNTGLEMPVLRKILERGQSAAPSPYLFSRSGSERCSFRGAACLLGGGVSVETEGSGPGPGSPLPLGLPSLRGRIEGWEGEQVLSGEH